MAYMKECVQDHAPRTMCTCPRSLLQVDVAVDPDKLIAFAWVDQVGDLADPHRHLLCSLHAPVILRPAAVA